MTRHTTPSTLLLLAPAGAIAMLAAGTAEAATPTYYANQAMFQADITSTVTDNYSSPGYVFNQGNAAMSAVLGETDYMSTGHNNLNLVVNAPADPRYCSGCNGSFQLSFLTTSVGNAAGVNGVGLVIEAHDVGMPYFAFITFADGTTANIQLPGAGNFWGVAAPERIQQIHFGLSMGVGTTNGYFEMDDLIVGDGNVGGCEIDTDCFDDADPCTSPVCVDGLCGFDFNTAPCDDGDICTEMDTCFEGVCAGPVIDCDDGNVCTTNFCDPGSGCVLALNTEPCDDGNSCTSMDACSAGACGGVMMDCDDGDVCSMDSCVDGMGCVNEPTTGCCVDDSGCDDDEICDLDENVCIPLPSSDSSGTSAGDTGTGTGPSDSTGLDGTGNGESGIGTGIDTGLDSLDTGLAGSSDDGSTDSGALPPTDPSGCGCTTDAPAQGRLWWLVAGLGLFIRRRRRAA